MSVANNEEKELQNEDAIICICDSDVDDNATIQCDRCGRWQHMRCVGIDPAIVDLDDLVYHCDRCDPRPLDVQAAKSYIDRYRNEETQTLQIKPRRGRGKGSGRRGGHASSPGVRTDARRTKTSKQVDSDETDDMTETFTSNSGLRDYTLIESYMTTDQASIWLRSHADSYPICPASVATQSISTVIKSIGGTNGQAHGLFADRDAPANAFVGRYLGLLATLEEYKVNSDNRFDLIRGPLPRVVLVEQCGLVIDARLCGNEARYLRKSCSPNCSVVPLILEAATATSDAVWQFSIALNAAVTSGDELTIGYQWSERKDDRRDSSNVANDHTFAQNVLHFVGECACGKPQMECDLTKLIAGEFSTRKRSLSGEVENREADLDVDRKGPTEPSEQPMTREERKIQMAIARMESADVPKTKRRRRNTGDDGVGPVNGRRASSLKADDTSAQPEEPPNRSVSPVIPAKSGKPPKISTKPRGKLIRSSSPEELASRAVPWKTRWLKSFVRELAIKEEQKLKLAEQAREATTRLAEEASRKRMEIENQLREAREAKEREAEELRKQNEREAREASQRAREREIWGDHPSTSRHEQTPRNEEAKTADSTLSQGTQANGAPSRQSPVARNDSPTAMGPPALLKDGSNSSPPTAPSTIPKVVRKLSVSEYMRQRKERATGESPSSPMDDSSRPAEIKATVDTIEPKVEDDKSDGEIESEESEAKPVVPVTSASPHNSTAARGEFLQMPPTAPKAASTYQQQPSSHPSQGPIMHPSRAYQPSPPVHASNQHNHFQSYPRHNNFGADPRQQRVSNSAFSTNNNNSSSSNNNNFANHNHGSYQRAPIPTGPKYSRSNSGSDSSGAIHLPYHSSGTGSHVKDNGSNREPQKQSGSFDHHK